MLLQPLMHTQPKRRRCSCASMASLYISIVAGWMHTVHEVVPAQALAIDT